MARRKKIRATVILENETSGELERRDVEAVNEDELPHEIYDAINDWLLGIGDTIRIVETKK